MSKLAIILCAVLFASAANASFLSEKMDKAVQTLDDLIELTIAKVRSSIAEARQKSDEVVAEIEAQTANHKSKIASDVSEKLQNALHEVNELTGAIDGVDVTKCTELIDHLQYTARVAVLQAKKCFADKRTKAAGYVENMLQAVEGVIANLEVHKQEAHECIETIDGLFSGAKGLVCTNLVAAKAGLSTAKAVPAVAAETVKLTFLLATLPPSLVYCTTTNALDTFYYESSIIADKASKCIQENIDRVSSIAPDGFRASTPKTVTKAPEITFDPLKELNDDLNA